jgi:CheY-like chemotaxis protein
MNTLLGKTILVAEDDGFVRKVITMALERMGATVASCEHGVQALELLNGPRRFDGVLLDVLMPHAHGLHVLKEIRSGTTAQPYALPVALLTAAHDEACVRAAADLSCDGFIAKPVSPQALTERLNKMFARIVSLPFEPRYYRKFDVGRPDEPPDFSPKPGSVEAKQRALQLEEMGLVVTIEDLRVGMQFATPVIVGGKEVVPAEKVVTSELLRLLLTLDKIEKLGPLIVLPWDTAVTDPEAASGEEPAP